MGSAGEELEGIIARLSETETREAKVVILKSLVEDEGYAGENIIETFISKGGDGGGSDSTDDDDDGMDDEYYLNFILLLVAVLERKSDWTKHLIEVRQVDPSEHLRFMLKNGHLEHALFLIEAGTDVNSISYQHKCELLTAAVYAGNKGQVKTFIQAGADVNTVDNKGNTPLLLRVKNGYNQCMDLLMESSPNVNTVDENGNTKLLMEDNGFNECVNLLIESGADVNSANKKKNTPLMYAAPSDVETLLKAGADVNATNRGGVTALILKARSGDDLSVRRLLESGADVNSVDNLGETALTGALYFGHKNCVRLLIDAGADVNSENNVGDTALITAAWSGRPELVRILLEAGAHVHKTNNRGQNALTCHVAQCETFSEELALMLVAAGEVLHISQEEDNNGKRVVRYGSRGIKAHIKVPDILLSNRLCHFKQLPDSQVMPSESRASGANGEGDGNNDDHLATERSFAPKINGNEDPVISSSDTAVSNEQAESSVTEAGDDGNSETVAENPIVAAADSGEENTEAQKMIENAEESGVLRDLFGDENDTIISHTAVNRDDDHIKTQSVDINIVLAAETKSDGTTSSVSDVERRKIPSLSDKADDDSVDETTAAHIKDAKTSEVKTSDSTYTKGTLARAKTVELYHDSGLGEEEGDVNKESGLGEEGGEVNKESGLIEGSDVNKESGSGEERCDVNVLCIKSSGKRSHSDAFCDDNSGAADSDGDTSNISNTSDGRTEADSGTAVVERDDAKEDSPRKRFRCALM